MSDTNSFLEKYAADDNEYWRTPSGEIRNILDDLIDRLAEQREQITQEIEAARKRFVEHSKTRSLDEQFADASGIACFDLSLTIARGRTE